MAKGEKSEKVAKEEKKDKPKKTIEKKEKKAKTPKAAKAEKGEKVKKEEVKSEENYEGLGISKGIKDATIKGAAKKQGLRCQRSSAVQLLSAYLKQHVAHLAETGLRNAEARGAATITRADCIELTV